MADSPASSGEVRSAGEPPLDGARRLFRASESSEGNDPRDRYLEQLTTYLTFVEERRGELAAAASELARQLGETSLAFYRLGQSELAGRAVDLGLGFAPADPALLHRKAQFLLASNHDAAAVLPLLEEASQRDPNDKAIWATLGDTLKLLGRTSEATEAYLRAQELDPTSTQFVEKALRLSPGHVGAQRLCLKLAKAHGGTDQALSACEALLSASPSDPELLFARVDLLAQLGQIGPALDAVAPARAARPGDARLALIAGRLHLASGQTKDALDEFRLAAEGIAALEPVEVAELADRIEAAGGGPELAITIRQGLLEREPRNLANLQALRRLAQAARRFDLGIAACQKILEASPDNLEALRALAEFQITAGHAEEGFETYRALVRANPHETGEIRRAAESARSAGRVEVFREFARAALEEEPADLATREQLARSYASTGERERALEQYEALLEAAPTETRILWETKQLLGEMGRTAELPRIYDRLYLADPANTRLAYERGAVYLGIARQKPPGSDERVAAGREAIASYERASSDPKIAEESLVGLAAAARLAGNPARAVAAYEEFLKRPGHEGNAQVLKELGEARYDAGHYLEADRAFQKALALGLEDPELLWGASETLAALTQDARALQLVEILCRRQPDEVRYQRRRGLLLLRTGRSAEGIGVLREASAKAPGDAATQFDAAQALRASGAYSDAIEFYRKGLAIASADRSGRLGLAETFNLAGRYNEVVPVADALLNEDPNDLAAWRARADACRALGRTSDLEYSLKAILLLDPTHAPTLVEKYRLHLSLGEKAEAFACLADFLEAGGPESKDPALLLEAGDLAAELGKADDAHRFYERAQEIDPSQAVPIGLRRARLKRAAGRPDLALEVLEAAAKSGPVPPGAAHELGLQRAETLMALERPAEAEAVYRSLLADEPGGIPVRLGLGRALLEQGKHSEAKTLLTESIPLGAPVSGLYLLLAEADSGLGAIPEAVGVVEEGLKVLPDSVDLYTRLGELNIAREAWEPAGRALVEAVQRDGTNPDLLLRAGFVAERRGQSTEALALYERVTQVAPTNKFGWSSRGLALLSQGRSEEATASFEHALSIDPEFEAARQGKKTALEKARVNQIDKLGKEALLLEARLHRAATRNDLFVTLHVPFDLLEPVLSALSRDPQVDLASLSEDALHDLETASCQLISAAIDRRTEGVERRGFTLADVAVLSPPTRSLSEIQRLFGYLKAVLEVDLRPENLKLTPDVEELARRALLLAPDQRGLFQLVRDLRVGIFKARLIKAVESAGSAVHAPLPSLDIAEYTAEVGPADHALVPEAPPAPASSHSHPSKAPAHGHGAPVPAAPPTARPVPQKARCVGCGGLASIVHTCGAPVCAHCIAEFHTCPKCRQPAIWPGAAAAGASPEAEPDVPEPPAPVASPHSSSGTLHALRHAVSRPKPAPVRSAPHPPAEPEHHPHAAPPPEPATKPRSPPHPQPKSPADDEPRL